ncbi:FCD domain-containing protein [Streptomyces sp. NPDC048111]|uniref:FCD domain-containing protein n=1 Tax=Streptomyces sp. NPDC048111 TaxID=3365500 RepID=UPI003723E4B6
MLRCGVRGCPAKSRADARPRPARARVCARVPRAVAGNDADLAVATNAASHARIKEPAGNAVLVAPAGQVDRWVRWYYSRRSRQRGKQPWIEHRDLIVALSGREEPRAAELMRAHADPARKSCLERSHRA